MFVLSASLSSESSDGNKLTYRTGDDSDALIIGPLDNHKEWVYGHAMATGPSRTMERFAVGIGTRESGNRAFSLSLDGSLLVRAPPWITLFASRSSHRTTSTMQRHRSLFLSPVNTWHLLAKLDGIYGLVNYIHDICEQFFWMQFAHYNSRNLRLLWT